MKKILLSAVMATALLTACKKDEVAASQDFNTTKDVAIADFVNKIALPGYEELKNKGNTLNNTVTELNSNPTENNLVSARNAWKDMRSTWEKCEGYLFGPVDENEYDPETDSWPVNFVDMDQLLASSDGLGVDQVEAMSRSLKGYHPLEYILWGEGGTRTAASLTPREKEYMVSLATLLKENADNLYNDWISTGGNYAATFLTAGTGSTVFVKKQDAFIAITEGLIGICGEVGAGKMLDPYELYLTDPALAVQSVESPYSGNSFTDFKNNIVGAYNVYLGKFNADGTGVEDLVKARNSALDVKIQQKFNAAIQSFNSFTVPFEEAIVNERTQCAATMTAIDDLATVLEQELKPFIITNITD